MERGRDGNLGPNSNRMTYDYDDDGKQAPLNAGSRGMARDPAEIYERQEARTCAGCEHITTVTILGEPRPVCAKGKRYGKRCKLYVEREPSRR